MKITNLIGVLFITIGISWAYDESAVVWDRAYGGSNYDVGTDIAVDPDGYYVVVGGEKSYGFGNYDYWILKLDPASGDTVWSRIYGGSNYDYARAVSIDPSGYYVVNGITKSFGSGQHDFWILKIDATTGDTVWSRTYGGSDFDQGFDIIVDDEGYYVAIGATRSFGTSGSYDAMVLKIDPSSGDTLWMTTVGGSDFDRVFGIAYDSQAYIVAGYEESPEINGDTVRQGWIIKIDRNSGAVIWQKSYGGNTYDAFMDVKVDADGYYIVAGRTASFSAGGRDGWLLKINPSTGDTLWTSIVGGSDDDRFYGIDIDQNGDYITIGYTSTYGAGSNDMWMVKFDHMTGDTLWTATFGADSADRGEHVVVDGNGYYVGAGYTRSYGSGRKDFWIVKVNGIDIMAPYIDSLTTLGRDTTGNARDVNVFAMDDKSGIEAVELYYKAGSGSWSSVPMNPVSGGWYQGQIPPMSLPADSIQVLYFARAYDSTGNISGTDTLSYWLVNPSVSIGENARPLSITPVSGGLKFTVDNTLVQVKIFDPAGRVIKKVLIRDGNHYVPLHPGIFILDIKQGENTRRVKVLVR